MRARHDGTYAGSVAPSRPALWQVRAHLVHLQPFARLGQVIEMLGDETKKRFAL